MTPLHAAARVGSTAVIAELLKRGAEIDHSDVYGVTALITATQRVRADAVAALLEAGADANVVGPGPGSALHVAAYLGHDRIAELLLEGGAKPNLKAGEPTGANPPLIMAAMGRSTRMGELLLEHGADVNGRNGKSQTALGAAAGHGRAEIAELLLARGADKDWRDADGVSATEAAATNGHVGIASRLYYADVGEKRATRADE